jgi:glycosyltransferase involved in cell wall biosynthesis
MSDVNQPLITIGITCFNAVDTIGRAMQSALAQDWPAFEIVVVDDYSSDGSFELLTTLAAREPRVSLIRHKANKGAAAARNTILENAHGVYVAFFDDDDESYPSRLTVQSAAIQRSEDATETKQVACYASGERLYSNGYRIDVNAIGSVGRPILGTEVIDYLLINERVDGAFYGGGTPTCALMVRTDILRQVGGFDPALRRAEDIDLAVRLGRAGARFIGCPERLYLQHATISVDKSPERDRDAMLAVIEKNRDYLTDRGLYYYARQWFRLRACWFSSQYLRAGLTLLPLLCLHPLRVLRHILRSAPARLRHERAMLTNQPAN